MRSLFILGLGLAATTASAQTLPGSTPQADADDIVAGAATGMLGEVYATAFNEATDYTHPFGVSKQVQPQIGGDFRAMAVGADSGIWTLHAGIDTLSVQLIDGGAESYDISATDTNWADMVATPSGRVYLGTVFGNVYEVDVSDGTLLPTPYSQTLPPSTKLYNLATVGDTLYLATRNYVGSVFNAIRYNVETEQSLADQPLPYHQGHTFWVFDNGDVLVNDNRDGAFLKRHAPDTSTVWSRSFFFTADATVADDGSLWVLRASDEIYRLDAATGVNLDTAQRIFCATGCNSRGPFEAASLLNVEFPEAPQPTTDNCPDNPEKFEEGVCGCDFYDVPGLTWPDGNPGTGCVHITADYDDSGTIGDGAYVMPYATVGAGSHVEQDAIVGAHAVVGDNVFVVVEAVIARGAQVGSNAYIGRGTLIGRDVTIGAGASIAGSVTIGYGSKVPAFAQLLGGSIIGNLVDLGTGTFTMGIGSRESSTIGRGVTFSNGAVIGGGVVIGPQSTFGDSFAAGDGTRIRKRVGVGDNVTLGTDVRLGRNSELVGNNIVGNNAELSASATVALGHCIAPDQDVGRGITVDDQLCP